ncbi:CcdB family protein [Rhizobium sp. SAFR-030]|uniref:CcdB family protein n=1 Tax=Rhizobium sp. SAFR-030 TaxID=3387277 RepID=UPI003F81911C
MPRFAVYRSSEEGILLLDLQADVLDGLRTRVVVPLYSLETMPWSIGRMNPRFKIGEVVYTMATQRMAAISHVHLGPVIADLSARADDITAATDFLFQDF